MDLKIVFQGKTKKGIEILIRYPLPDDALLMTKYINKLSDERTFITYQGEHETLENETNFLKKKIKSISENKSVMLLAFSKDKLIGISGIDLGTRTSRHIGTFGISVAEDFRRKGVGKLLLECIEAEAKQNLPNLEIIILGVFANNEKAINLYRKSGYEIEGLLPKGVKLEKGYVDHIFMYKMVK